MAEGKKSFQLYTDLIELVNGSNKHNVEIEPMTNEEAGMLFKWILEYVNDLHPSVPKEIRFAVVQVKKQLDEDLERWKDICKKNTENINKRWHRNENESIRPNTTVYDSIPTDTKNTDKDKDKDKDILKENTTIGSIKEKSTQSRFIPPTLEEIQTYVLEKNYNIDSERFFDFYQSKGWMVGKNKMKDWKAAVRNWNKTDNPKTIKSGLRDNPIDEPNGGFTIL